MCTTRAPVAVSQRSAEQVTALFNATLIVPQDDPLQTPVGRGEPIPQSDGRPDWPCPRETLTVGDCITMHGRSPPKLSDPRDPRGWTTCVFPPRVT
jgi:hypothetical protein